MARRGLLRWAVSLTATVASTYALDAFAAVAGAGLVAARIFAGVGTPGLVALLLVTYAAWGLGLRSNVRANWALLVTTGTSTNVLSKAAYDLTRRRTAGGRAPRVAAATGYIGTEIAKEVPYYLGAFGAAALTETITSTGALIFLSGANLGAALYEYGLARATQAFVRRRRRRYASFDPDWVPAEYLAGYYRRVEPDEVATIAFFVEAARRADPDRPVLFFGVGPTLHHVFAFAEVAAEIHLADLLPANLTEIRRWLDRAPGAHDWRPFVRHTLRCEGVDDPGEAEVTAREDLTRKKITELIEADGRRAAPVPRQYPTVVSGYCADSATGDRESWQRFMGHLTGLVGPGGLFVTAALRRCRQYTVADKVFAAADIDERDLRAVLADGFDLGDARIEVVPVALDAAHGYSAIVLGRARRRAQPARLDLVGAAAEVPLVGGGTRRYVNLDYAASAPCLVTVQEAVNDLLPWYSSVHRGAGDKSRLCTQAYEDSRETVRTFVGGHRDDVVVFTRNTTDAMNLPASALPPGTEVLAFAAEHHANLLPWRRRDLTLLPLPAGPDEALDLLDRALSRPADDLDYLALSGHKLYAPFGTGALVGRRDWLGAGEPYLVGGGAVRYVGTGTTLWADLPDRQEAGSPNVIGAVALAAACRTLQAADRESLEMRQVALIASTRERLLAVPGIEVLRLWPARHPRIGVLPFTLRGVPYARLAAILSAQFAIGVRHGCFCAHPLMAALLHIDAAEDARLRDGLRRRIPTPVPGAVRASTGLGTTAADCDRLVAAVATIAADGPRWTYESTVDGTDCHPVPDPRRLIL